MADYPSRQRALLELIGGNGFVAVNHEGSDPATIRYLAGFTGEGALLLWDDGALLLTDSRYTEQARRETRELIIEETRPWRSQAIAEALVARRIEHLVFSSDRVSHRWFEEMRDLADDCVLDGQPDPVSPLRRTKSPEEIDHLRRAARIADEALEALLPRLRVGMTEAEVALELELLIRRADTEGVAFVVNASAGPNTALNHYHPALDPRPIADGDLLLLDFGACCGGYRSDTTRTFSVGAVHPRAKEIYGIVLEANNAAIAAARSGEPASAVDAVARDLIAEAGYGDAFGHGLGHGIGLEVHEAPALTPRHHDPLQPGMTVTIEPGIYLPGFGGVRIEDDVVITADGAEVITGFPKSELLEVGA